MATKNHFRARGDLADARFKLARNEDEKCAGAMISAEWHAIASWRERQLEEENVARQKVWQDVEFA